ncbi:MAG: ABC transporter permease [Bacteroidales bacterium]|nr:ABC transporter permease [Bacteroidales bacterium]
MNPLQFIKRNLLYFRKKNLSLALGIAISTAVITGSLIVGDSVRHSLESIVGQRLGKITHVIKFGDRFFSSSLSDSLSADLNIPSSTALMTSGVAVNDGGAIRIGNIQILGVDQNFDAMAGLKYFYSSLSGDEVILSQDLAERLNAKPGDRLLFRISRTSLIPLNAPFVSDKGNIVSAGLKVVGIAGTKELGRFNLKNSQSAALNAFVSYEELCGLMDFEGKANLIFLAAPEIRIPEIQASLKKNWSLEDAGMKLKLSADNKEINLTSDRVFIDDIAAEALLKTKGLEYPVLTYFVNSISSGKYKTPYSFVSSYPFSDLKDKEIIINRWLADDLHARPGDSLQMQYFVVGPLRELKVEEKSFVIKSITEQKGYFGDQSLMPDLPGLSDAGNCRDWETGIPIKLDEIRDKDEEYWKKFRGTPKAFVSIETAKNLWANRFGSYTSFRFSGDSSDFKDVSREILAGLDPLKQGLTIGNNRIEAENAAKNGVDFSQLFAGLSFFLLLGGIILSILLFLLNLDSRKDQILDLSSLGIPLKKIKRMLLAEGMMVALAGSVTGIFLAVLYNRLIFAALNTIWSDIVRTDVMLVDIRVESLLLGFLISILLAWASINLPLGRFLKKQFLTLKQGKTVNRSGSGANIALAVSVIAGLSGMGMIAGEILNKGNGGESLFFAAGGLILFSGLSLFYYYLKYTQRASGQAFNLPQLSWSYIFRNPSRSLSIVILFALGSFLVVSTGSNRKNLFSNSASKSSGTGGFLFYAESTLPFLHNLNDSSVRYEMGLSQDYQFLQFPLSAGDDASCLNLNKISNPAILGVDPSELEGCFSFESKTSLLNESNPWASLDTSYKEGIIPGIADETVIKWGLGLKDGDTLVYKNSAGADLKVILIGGLSPSIFQGRVLISKKNFLHAFPEHSGSSVFLINGVMEDSGFIKAETKAAMRDYGWDISLSAARLAEFNSVTNTYLSIFMVLGALGLLLGTVGLGIVLFRSILERRKEIAIMKAVGIPGIMIRKLIVSEFMILLRIGIGIGFVSAIIATFPSLAGKTGVSVLLIFIMFVALLLVGRALTYLFARNALKEESIYKELTTE